MHPPRPLKSTCARDLSFSVPRYLEKQQHVKKVLIDKKEKKAPLPLTPLSPSLDI